MTEDDAKTKWCPMARTLYAVGTPGGQIFAAANVFLPKPGEETRSTCIAAGCMMWRWSFIQKTESDTFPSQGFCGLAGRDGASVEMPVERAEPLQAARRVGKGVYNNPQPGDTDFPGG